MDQDFIKLVFRVICNCNGQGYFFDFMGVVFNFGGVVYNYFYWNVFMKQFDIEVILNIEGNEVFVCLVLICESLYCWYIIVFGLIVFRVIYVYNMLR